MRVHLGKDVLQGAGRLIPDPRTGSGGEKESPGDDRRQVKS